MNITCKQVSSTDQFSVFLVAKDSEYVEVVISPPSGSIHVSPRGRLPRGVFKLDNWMFDNVREDLPSVATLAGLAVLLGGG